MRLYPENIEVKLGIDKIKEELDSLCLSPLGQKYVQSLKPSNKADSIRKLLLQTEEFQKLLISGNSFPQKNYFDIRAFLKKSEVPGSFLGAEELFEIKLVLITILDMIDVLATNQLECPSLYDLSRKVELSDQLPGFLDSKIDERGELRDNASKELMEIRSKVI